MNQQPSHRYEFKFSDVLRLVGGPCVPVLLFALLLHGGKLAGLWPAPRPALDMDRTILVHQAHAAQSPQTASLVVAGDSSGLMDVEARALSASSADEVLSLATLSFVDLATHGRLLATYAKANPGKLKTVVLLLHPEGLRRPDASTYHVRVVTDFLTQRDQPRNQGLPARVETWLGYDIFRGRILARVLPQPLNHSFAHHYGFTHDLWSYLETNQGSAIDPNQFDKTTLRGNAEYRLARRMEADCQSFREQLPIGVKLVVGFTPVPESFAPANYTANVSELRRQLSGWLRADVILEALPLTMPDDQFASVTHLNAQGREVFTKKLAELLKVTVTAPVR